MDEQQNQLGEQQGQQIQPSEQPPRQSQEPLHDEQAKNAPEQAQIVAPQWQYQSGNLSPEVGYNNPAPQGAAGPNSQEDSTDTIRWNASEFVNHEKTGGWYFMVAAGALVVAAIIYLLTRDIFSVVVIVLLAVAVAIFGALKPRVLDYGIGPDGIIVGKKHFNYETFRSFAVIDDGALPSIQLLPHKRFMVPITMYFAPTDGDHIVAILGDYLPFEHRELDFVDKISAKFHF